jgi:hypothetical protein
MPDAGELLEIEDEEDACEEAEDHPGVHDNV